MRISRGIRKAASAGLWLVCLSAAACGGDGDSSADAGSGGDDAGAGGRASGMGGAGGTGGAAGTGGADAGDAGSGGASGQGGSDAGPAPTGTLSERYPGDEGIAADPAVLFHDDFESGWGRWDLPEADTSYLHLEDDAATARGGAGYLRSTVTTQHLEEDMYISSSTRASFERVDEVYWRFYARFPEVAPNPHHWVRMAAGDRGFTGSGLANTVPAGDEGFWFDFDANNDDQFNFYVYWYRMRSGRCNDGSATPGCEGDQGTTYYYGNVFRPPDQTPFPRDRWFCIEIHAKANRVGTQDGELSFWIDDAPVGAYRPGHPEGTWLRATFHTDGCDFSACTAPRPFEGFDFRSSDDVGFKRIFLDAYYERESAARKRAALEDRGLSVSDTQTILYDDVVVATERIGCVR